jgi:hypothetical protein
MAREITVEMMDALDTLRGFAERNSTNTALGNLREVAEAINVLDNKDFFAPITDAKDEEDERMAQTMAGLLGVDLNDRYPKGDERGIISPDIGSTDQYHWTNEMGTT